MEIWEQVHGEWTPTPVPEHEPFRIGDAACIVRWADGTRCAILVRGDVEVNGCPPLPLHILAHKDEIRVGGRRLFISLTSEPRVFRVAKGSGLRCGRCSVPLESTKDVVRCGLCLSIQHDDCFAYEPKCGVCDQPTSWTPESLDEHDDANGGRRWLH